MYEFNETENKTIEETAKWAKILGLVNFGLAGISILDGLNGLMNVALYGALGYILLVAAQSLTLVVETEGEDVDHLMKALDGLNQLFTIRLALLILALFFVGAAILIMMLAGAAGVMG
jgi:hypothetical protein